MNNHPKIKLPYSLTRKTWDGFLLLFTIIFWFYIVRNYSQLPDIIPTHYNFKGEVDGYGDKWTIILLPAIATVMTVGLTVLQKFPYKFNYTVTITETNAEALYQLAIEMLQILKTSLMLMFFYIAYETIQIAKNEMTNGSRWFLPVTLISIHLVVFYYLIKMSKHS